MQLARPALEHDAAGGADLRTVLLRRPGRLALGGRLDDDLVLAGANPVDGPMAVESLSPGVDPQFANLLQLIATSRFECGPAGCFIFGWFGHAIPCEGRGIRD